MDLKNTCNYILAGLALIAGLSLASCKKDNTETYPSLTGVPEFSLPAYGKAGETFTFKAGGVTADDGSDVFAAGSASGVIELRRRGALTIDGGSW